ncbi:MAG: AEC family transporter [Cellulosilyticaceae bacterium]
MLFCLNLSPAVVAVYIGVLLMLCGVILPEVILSPIKTVGSMTSPLSMLIVGAILARVKIGKYLKDWTIYYTAFTKLVILPVVIYGITFRIGDVSRVAHTMVLLTAMPVAAMTSIFAENYNKEKEYAAVVVFITTLFSVLTFPLVLQVIG